MDTRYVHVTQRIAWGEQHLFSILKHELPLPIVGDYIHYAGTALEIKRVMHHYDLDENGRYFIARTELVVE